MSAVGGGRDTLIFPRGGNPMLLAPVVPDLPRVGAMEGGPPEKSLKEGCVCCHEGFVRCCFKKQGEINRQ